MAGWIKGWADCSVCGDKAHNSHPHCLTDKGILCWDCGFKAGEISGREYLDCSGVYLDSFHAAVDPQGEIIIWMGKPTPPWERNSKDYRRTALYQGWRKTVFERDNYTCQDCKQHGGNLEAHHIKTVVKHPDLCHVVDNGITLCKKCHKNRHRKKVGDK